MSTFPKTFKTLSIKAGIPEENIQDKWLGIWETTISQFLTWLVESNELDNDQIIKLKEVLQKVLKKDAQKKGIMDLIKSVIRENQQKTIIDKFASLFVINLERYYQVLNKKGKK